MRRKDWYRVKKYPHIGLPLEPIDRVWVSGYVRNKSKVASHAFFPFIRRNTVTRKFRKQICHDGTRSKLRLPSQKVRELHYCTHLDSNIFSFYSAKLSKLYEKRLNQENLSDCITAYRKIRLHAGRNSRNKNNIDFANEVFQHLVSEPPEPKVALALDVKGFFDNLNHKKLKSSWINLFDDERSLPPDHYNIFKHITQFSYIDEKALFDETKESIVVERAGSPVTKRVARKEYLKSQRALAFLTKEKFSSVRELGLVKSNKRKSPGDHNSGRRDKGIPQGSPISAVLANIYMIEFDKLVNAKVIDFGGIYRRYSDDILVICSPEHASELHEFITQALSDCLLEVQSLKTRMFHFRYSTAKGRFNCFEQNRNTGKVERNTNLEYLGFQFDGKHVMLKDASLAKFYRRMKRSVRRGVFYATHNRTSTRKKLFKGRLYKKYTYLGSARRRKFEEDPNTPGTFIQTKKYDWGNYLTYAYMASRIFPENKIRSQVRRHWMIFHSLIKDYIQD